MKLSIIVPVYNVEPYIEKCLESIHSQTFRDFECIMIDDGSTDKSGEFCEAYARIDSRFHFIRQQNKGVNFARDIALHQASGEYIGFVDADDYIAKNMFSALMASALKNDADITIGGWWELKKNSCKPVNLYPQNRMLSKELAMEDLALDHMRSYLWNKLFKRSVLEEPRVLLTAKNMGDYSWMHHIFHKAKRFYYIAENLYFYRDRDESIVHAINLEKRIESYKIVKSRSHFYEKYYPHLLIQANCTLFKFAWNLCKNYACPQTENNQKIYLDADKFIRAFARQYIKQKSLSKRKQVSLLLYIHFTGTVQHWKSLQNKVDKLIISK